jgi:hypothetical protein
MVEMVALSRAALPALNRAALAKAVGISVTRLADGLNYIRAHAEESRVIARATSTGALCCSYRPVGLQPKLNRARDILNCSNNRQGQRTGGAKNKQKCSFIIFAHFP